MIWAPALNVFMVHLVIMSARLWSCTAQSGCLWASMLRIFTYHDHPFSYHCFDLS
jgi:hypothetical protein